MLGTDLGTLSDERAAPNSIVLRQDVEPLIGSLVARILVVTLRQRRGTREERVEPINRTSSVAKQAVDAHAELLVGVQLIGGLEVFAFLQRLLVLTDDPRFYLGEFREEIRYFDDEVPHHGEVFERLYSNRTRRVIGQE